MKIDLLYFEGCPSWRQGLENLIIALKRENIVAHIQLVKVLDDIQADQLKFLGSPTFQVDGKDLWSEERSSYNLCCRLYPAPAGLLRAPSVEMLQEKLR